MNKNGVNYPKIAILFYAFFSAALPIAFATDPSDWDETASFTVLNPPGIAELQWDAKVIPVQNIDGGPQDYHLIVLHGKFPRVNWNLLANLKPVKLDPKDSSFQILVQLEGAKRNFDIEAIGPYGATEKMQIAIQTQKISETKRLRYFATVGFSTLSHDQTTVTSTTGKSVSTSIHHDARSITPQVGAKWIDPKDKWGVTAEGWISALDISKDTSQTTIAGSKSISTDARFWHFELLGSYRFYRKNRYSFSALGGAGTSGVMSSTDLGVKNQSGPIAGIQFNHDFKGGENLAVFARFEPITSGTAKFSLKDREIQFGSDWVFSRRAKYPIILRLEDHITRLSSATQSVSSNRVSFSIGSLF